jgi:hypothetical protein
MRRYVGREERASKDARLLVGDPESAEESTEDPVLISPAAMYVVCQFSHTP